MTNSWIKRGNVSLFVKTGNAHFRKKADKTKRVAVRILHSPGATVQLVPKSQGKCS